MSSELTPLYDRVLVKRVEADETKGAIIIPDTAKEKPQEGEIVAVGAGWRAPDGTILPLAVKPGDRILFGKYSGSDVRMGGVDVLIMREEEILAIVNKPPAEPVMATTTKPKKK